jgi:hypothetical protein
MRCSCNHRGFPFPENEYRADRDPDEQDGQRDESDQHALIADRLVAPGDGPHWRRLGADLGP